MLSLDSDTQTNSCWDRNKHLPPGEEDTNVFRAADSLEVFVQNSCCLGVCWWVQQCCWHRGGLLLWNEPAGRLLCSEAVKLREVIKGTRAVWWLGGCHILLLHPNHFMSLDGIRYSNTPRNTVRSKKKTSSPVLFLIPGHVTTLSSSGRDR